jgi:hypothetical protein
MGSITEDLSRGARQEFHDPGLELLQVTAGLNALTLCRSEAGIPDL